MTTAPTAQELATLAAMMGRTDQKGIEDALRAHMRAQRTLSDAGILETSEASTPFLNGMPLDAVREGLGKAHMPIEVVTDPGSTNGENPHYIASDERTIIKYIAMLHEPGKKKPMGEAAAKDHLEFHRTHGFSPHLIQLLQSMRKKVKSDTGKKNRVNASKPRRKRKPVK